MPALEALRNEHRMILRGLDSLEAFARKLAEDPGTDVSELGLFAKFFIDFAELWHHGKEEDVLLPELVRAGLSWDEGPVARVRQDHEQENYLARVLEQAAAQDRPWTQEDMRHAQAMIRGFIDFEREHIEKEERLLYPTAERMLTGPALEELERRLTDFEQHKFGGGGYAEVRAAGEALFRRHAT